MSWECPENKTAGFREAHITEAQQKIVETETKEEVVEEGRSLMMRKSLVKPGKGGARANTKKEFVQNCLQVKEIEYAR
jgi:hypothetical protein